MINILCELSQYKLCEIGCIGLVTTLHMCLLRTNVSRVVLCAYLVHCDDLAFYKLLREEVS